MAYTIPEKVRDQMQQQATAAGLPYATIVAQRLYDLQGLATVLQTTLDQAQQAVRTTTDPVALAAAKKQVADVSHKLAHCQDEVTAYQQEEQAAQK